MSEFDRDHERDHDRDRERDRDDLFDQGARRLLRRNGIDIGDIVVVVLRGGPTLTGRLVAAFDNVIRIVTTVATTGTVGGTVVPVGTLLTINVDDIAAIGRTTGTGVGGIV